MRAGEIVIDLPAGGRLVGQALRWKRSPSGGGSSRISGATCRWPAKDRDWQPLGRKRSQEAPELCGLATFALNDEGGDVRSVAAALSAGT